MLDTPSTVVAGRAPGHRGADRGHARVPRRRVPLPRRRNGRAVRHLVPARGGHDHGDHRQHRCRARPRWSTSCPASSTSPRARCWSTASTSASSTPSCCGARIGLVPQKPYLFSGTVGSQPPLRRARRDRGGAVGGARDRPGRRLRPGDARRPRSADHPGRHQRVGRAAPAARHRPGAGPSPGDLPVRRLVLGARPGDRRPAAGRARAAHRRGGGADRRPAGLDHRRRRPDPRARGRRARRLGTPRGAARDAARRTPRSSSRSSPPRRRA